MLTFSEKQIISDAGHNVFISVSLIEILSD